MYHGTTIYQDMSIQRFCTAHMLRLYCAYTCFVIKSSRLVVGCALVTQGLRAIANQTTTATTAMTTTTTTAFRTTMAQTNDTITTDSVLIRQQ